MRKIFLLLSLIIFYSLETFSCSCFSSWNDSFSRTAKKAKFVALIKVISFDEYLDEEILGHEEKMPYLMTVEIVKKYKGTENRKRIKIWGDNGILCRPYLSEFKINGYYIVAPIPLTNKPNTDYDFFVCRTDYLEVDINKNEAYGNYSLIRDKINISTLENKLRYGDWDIEIITLLISFFFLGIFIYRRNKKQIAKKS